MLTSVRDRRIVCTQLKDGRHVAVVDWATATSNNLAVVPAINKAFNDMVDRVNKPKRPGREAKAVPLANASGLAIRLVPARDLVGTCRPNIPFAGTRC